MQITGYDINSLLCPCFDASDLNLLLETCDDRGQQVLCSDSPINETIIGCDIGDTTLGYRAGATNEVFGEIAACRLWDPLDNDPLVGPLGITPEQRDACLLLLRAYQDSGVCDHDR